MLSVRAGARRRRRGRAFEPIARENDPFLLPDMGASGVLGDPASRLGRRRRAVPRRGLPRARRAARRTSQPPTTEERPMTEFRAGAASLTLEPPLGLPMVGFIRQPWNARGYGLPLEVGALVLERGEHARRPLRRRRRRDHPPADRAAARPHRRSDGSRPAGDPPQPEPHASRAAGGRRERAPSTATSTTRPQRRSRRSPACCTTRSSPPAAWRPSGSSLPGSSGARPTSTLPSIAASGRRTASTGAPSSGGTRTSSSTTRSRCSRCAARTSRRSRRWSGSAAIPSRPATTWTSTRPTSPGRCGTSFAPSRAASASSSRARPGTCCRSSPSRTPRTRRAGWGRGSASRRSRR